MTLSIGKTFPENVDICGVEADNVNTEGFESDDWKAVTSTPEASRTHLLRTMFYNASLMYERELEALENLNRQEALKKISDLFEIPSIELWYYMEYGEEQTESLFNSLKGLTKKNVCANFSKSNCKSE